LGDQRDLCFAFQRAVKTNEDGSDAEAEEGPGAHGV
jgi:hypothetical protein